MPETPTTYYWATEPDPFALVETIQGRVETFRRTLKASAWRKRIIRNYRFYHGVFNECSEWQDLDILKLGEDGEYAEVPINHFRSLISHLMNLVASGKAAWDTKAINIDPESLQQARLGNAILDYYMSEKNVETVARTALEHALIFDIGYVVTLWDQRRGPDVEVEEPMPPGMLPPGADQGMGGMPGEMMGEGPEDMLAETSPPRIKRGGDVAYHNPTVENVIFDLSAQNRDEIQWCVIRLRENKWDLISRYPEFADDLIEKTNHERDDDTEWAKTGGKELESDLVWVEHFFHKPTDAMPAGRYVISSGTVPLSDTPCPYDELPIDVCLPGHQLLTCLGYSVANDLRGPQEWYNKELGAICTNHKTFAVQNLWAEEGSNLTVTKLEGKLNLIECATEPKPLNLTKDAPNAGEIIQLLGTMMEQLSGVNSVSRGQPEANLKSGTALALVDAKSVQAASGLQSSYYKMLEGVGSKTLRLLRKFGGETPRLLSIVGRWNQPYLDQFTAQDIANVDRVVVTQGNALSKTMSGRKEIADQLLEKGMIRTPETYFELLNTGQMESMMQAEIAELSFLREENSMLLRGETLVASAVDNHQLHIREHHGVLGSHRIRMDKAISGNVLAHIMEHVQLLQQPGVQLLQATLGYQVPIPPMPPPGMEGQGGGQPGPGQDAMESNVDGRPEGNAPAPQAPNVPGGMNG